MVEVVAFTGTFTDSCENRKPRVFGCNVVDEFHHVDGLADASTTEKPDLAAFSERADQVDDFDPGFQ